MVQAKEDDLDSAHVTHAHDDDVAETALGQLPMISVGNEVGPSHARKGEPLVYDMSVMDSNFYKLEEKKCNTGNDKIQTEIGNWSVRNGLMYVKSVGYDFSDLTSQMMNYFETAMALKIWKSLKALDGISRNENVVKTWSKFRGKYLLIILKSSCQTDVDIRVMSLNEEVRRILHSLKSSLMIPQMIMMSMVTMRRELKLTKMFACMFCPSIDVQEEFDDKNSLAQPFDAKNVQGCRGEGCWKIFTCP